MVEKLWTRLMSSHTHQGSSVDRGGAERLFGPLASVNLATDTRIRNVKKIALTLVAVSALSLAACQGAENEAAEATNEVEATANEADLDVNASEAAENALDAAANLTDQAGEAIENAAEATEEAAENTTGN